MYIRFCKWPVETPMICVFRSTCLCLWNKHVCWFYIRCLLGSPWWKPHGHVGPTYTYANICSQGWSYLHVDELHLNWGPILALNFTNPPQKKTRYQTSDQTGAPGRASLARPRSDRHSSTEGIRKWTSYQIRQTHCLLVFLSQKIS
jgi:hypothetical protein